MSLHFPDIEAEIVRQVANQLMAQQQDSKSPPVADRTWEPAVGEMCEGIVAPGVNAAGQTFRGRLHRYDNIRGRREAVLHSDDGSAWVLPESLRPASRPSLPEAQFYGVQPRELPKRLAAGFMCVNREYDSRYLALTDAVWSEEHCEYQGKVKCATSSYVSAEHASLPVHFIDWTTVRREQATHPPAPERHFCDDCGTRLTQRKDGLVCADCEERADAEPSRPAEAKAHDPYEHCDTAENLEGETDYGNFRLRNERLAVLTVSPDPLDRLAAKRSAHVEAHRKDMDRPLRHPSDWDVDDAPESYSTHGSGR